MYDIRQFKPALFALLLLGISGFALAGELLGIWLIAVGFILLNAWLVAIGRFRPMSRLVSNVITIGAVLYVIRELMSTQTTPVVVVGQFLVFLQLVKLWEQRANRDYAQLLILSLLLMVAASMNTASLWFGLLLVAYLFLSLYCCLLFHLKAETDLAKAAMPVPAEKLSPSTLRQDQRYLPRSMRRLTALVAGVALATAVLVFLLFPRGTGAGLLGPMQSLRTVAPLTGFSDQVTFQDVARITQSHETIAFVKLWHNDRLIEGTKTLYLRGLTLDRYGRQERGDGWAWIRTAPTPPPTPVRPSEPLRIAANSPDRWRQQIALWPTHTDVLFALAGPMELTPRRPLKVRCSPDGALQTALPLTDRVDYEVVSSDELGNQDDPAEFREAAPLRMDNPRIFAFARRPEVSGTDENGRSLADQRVKGKMGDQDEQIASNIEQYLRTHFAYTLDLSDESKLGGRSPIDAFLYDWKKGHCELFAGAMTLMCQTLGLQARMVIGFMCDGTNFNALNDQYTVHDSDAHAWVEVRTPTGWKTFDPTSDVDAPITANVGLLTRARHLAEYLEYTYANTVIAYDAQNQNSVVASVETGLTSAASRGSTLLAELHDFLFVDHVVGFWNVSTAILTGVMLLMILVLTGALGWFLWERALLRRRAARIGIESLPEPEQFRLARQLRFYDDLLRLLGRHRIIRPAHCTPLEFSRSLAFLPADAYNTVQRLTGLFYKIRYGGAVLPPARQRRLSVVLSTLGDELARPRAEATRRAP
jgi:protein-glutamine gamma-glutamyltransferase